MIYNLLLLLIQIILERLNVNELDILLPLLHINIVVMLIIIIIVIITTIIVINIIVVIIILISIIIIHY